MRNLAIARAGDDSKHLTWLSDPSLKNFDLLVASYSDDPERWCESADRFDHEPGLKYPWFHRFLDRAPWVFEYDAIWLCDDDIEADTATVADLFDIFHEHDLWLAQPSLSPQSICSFPLFLCRSGLLLRYTEFVEEQMPVFSGQSLRRLRRTFGETASGWGIGIAWPQILGLPASKLAVIDATPVAHRRPLQSSGMYTKVLPAAGIHPRDELERMRAKYGGGYHEEVVSSVIPLDPNDPRTPGRKGRQGVAL